MIRRILFFVTMMAALGAGADTNVTGKYIDNPDFEARFAGWHNDGFFYVTNASFSQKNKNIYMERWVASGGKIPNV